MSLTPATVSEASGWSRLRQASTWGFSLLALFLVWALNTTQAWRALEFKVFDAFTALTAPKRSSLPLVILAIDEPSFQQLGQGWPFPRSMHARLIERLQAEGAAAIGMDIVFADPSSELEDAALERAMAGPAPVVLASAREKVDSGNATLWTEVLPLRRLTQAGAMAGDAVVDPDDDFVVRRFVDRSNGFAQQLWQRLRPKDAVVPSAPDYIAYRGPRGSFDTRSYYQAVLPGFLPSGFFKDKIVLLGRSALTPSEFQHAQADLFNSPFGAWGTERLFPGVELQATLLDNLMTGGGLRQLPQAWSLALLLLCLPLLTTLGQSLRPGSVLVLTAGLLAGCALISFALFASQSLWLAPLFPMAGIAALYGVSALTEFARTRQRARQIRAMFAQYVPPEVVRRLIAQPELLRLGGEVREVTLMFTDLANFTTLSEQQTAQQTVELLTRYFNTMTPLIHRTGGTVDKFIGDAVMAFWGAPLADERHAEHAVAAAIQMQAAMVTLNAGLQARGLPTIHMRIGLHTGPVVVGNVGSDSRFSYTAIGDAVNLAARLEGANKAFGSGILLSSATAQGLPAGMPLRALDEVIVKGKSQAIRVYTPCQDAWLCTRSEQALAAFHAGEWDSAERLFREIQTQWPEDKAVSRLLARVAQARALMPGDPWSAAVALDKL